MGKSSNKHKRSTKGVDNFERNALGGVDPDAQSVSGADDNSMMDLDASFSEPMNHLQPQTCCPACQTMFEVPAELLASSDTRVRCGECLSIFDSLTNLRKEDSLYEDDDFLVDADGNIIDSDSPYASAMADGEDGYSPNANDGTANGRQAELLESPREMTDDTSALDVTYSDFDLFSGEVELPEVAYFDQTQDTGHLNFDDPAGDETFSDTLFSHDLTVEPVDLSPPVSTPDTSVPAGQSRSDQEPVVDDEIPSESLDFQYSEASDTNNDVLAAEATHAPEAQVHAPTNPSSPSAGHHRQPVSRWAVRLVLAVVLISIVVGLYSYRNRQALVQNPSLRPWLARICMVAACELPPIVALNQLKVLKRSVFTHPTIENSLVIDLAFVNQASFAQPYPVLEIRLTDRNGGLVTQNNFEPLEYLGQWQEGDLLSEDERLDLSLVLEDPGQNATSFELKFR